jgi:2,5-diketo-D-gluconate reductase A
MADDLLGSYELLQTMPKIGLGSFINDQAEQTVQRLVEFLNKGGRLIEIAELFANHHLLWDALSQCQINREDIYIIVKIWPQNQTPAALEQRIERFMQNSKFMYIDILLVHAPIDINNRFEQWNTLENMRKKGIAKTLGLANMSLNQVMTVIKNATLLPAFFQVLSTSNSFHHLNPSNHLF